jgi:hypothetical protein
MTQPRDRQRLVGEIPVNTKYNNGKEAEDGLLGITLDPGFTETGRFTCFIHP